MPYRRTHWLTTIAFLMAMVLVLTPDPAGSLPVSGRHRLRRGAQPAGGATGPATQHPVRHGHGRDCHRPCHPRGRPAAGGTLPSIQRPGNCTQNQVYSDCFLCGMVADNTRVYTGCCEGVPDICDFCQRLLAK